MTLISVMVLMAKRALMTGGLRGSWCSKKSPRGSRDSRGSRSSMGSRGTRSSRGSRLGYSRC